MMYSSMNQFSKEVKILHRTHRNFDVDVLENGKQKGYN